MALILLRHTTPDIADGVCYGQTDLDVTASFQEEAQAAFNALPPFDRIVSSPLQRCRKLAEFTAAKTGLTVQTDIRLMEMDFGTWEARAWADIPRTEIDAWANDFLHARPHGGESVAMLRTRVQAALHEIAKASAPTLIVTHAGVIRAALSSGDQADDFNAKIDFGGHFTISDLQGEPDE